MKLKIIIALSLLLLVIGCSPAVVVLDDSEGTEQDLKEVVDASNRFAIDFYKKINDDKNIFMSPYSISTALAMTYEGARTETAEEMQSVFYFPEDDLRRRAGYAMLFNRINNPNSDYELDTANRLWPHIDYTFRQEYFDIIEKYYGSDIVMLDYVNDRANARDTINSWIEDQTNDKIKDLIGPNDLTEYTRLVLTNAIYFKGTWLKEFKKKDNQDSEFKIDDDTKVMIPMMSIREEEWNYGEDDKMQILELPYDGEELSMFIILPKQDYRDFRTGNSTTVDITEIEEELSIEKIEEWKSMMSEREVDVSIPKFKFETKYYMAQELKEMGMPLAFTNDADFSGMDPKNYLKIDKVIHQAFIEVDEKGTEAAAATAVIMMEKAIAMTTPFRADHPFIFFIEHKETGAILFMGKVVNPE